MGALSALADRLDPPPVPVRDAFALLGYEPNCLPRLAARKDGLDIPACGQCPQERFHAATEDDVLYGGAMGGGKSLALLMEGIRACVRYPGVRVNAYRRTYDELEESLLKELRDRLPDLERIFGARFRSSPKPDLTFPNRSLIRFRHAETEVHASRRQGGGYQMLIVDELTLMNATVVERLKEALRSSKDNIPVLGIRAGTNPLGVGHTAAKRRYIDPTDRGAHTYTDDHGFSVRFVPAKASDNPHLDEAYHRRMDAIKDPVRRAAMADGSWDISGDVFSEWRHDLHVVRPFPVPSQWKRLAGIDWGFARPWVVEWGAVDNDRRLWIYREISEIEVGERDQAARILKAERDASESRVTRYADPSMWQRRGEVHPISEVYALAGCALEKATNTRVPGWQRVHTYLGTMAPACFVHKAEGKDECPLVHFFDTCQALVENLPALPRDPLDPEDVDTHADDDEADAFRYLVMALPQPFVARPRHGDPPPDLDSASTRAWHAIQELDNKRGGRKRREAHPQLGRD